MTDEQKIVFVVDDDEANLTACKQVLKPYYVVYTIPSAARMFDLLQHVTPDMILLDVEMPEMNGYEVARALKNNDAFKGIPVIFLSGRDDATSEMEGLSLGALDYIHKPFVSGLLLRRIEIHLSLIAYQKILEKQNKSIEELLEQKTKEVIQREIAEAEAKKASRAKGEFLSRMSHEIRTPLNAVIGMLSIAMDTDDSKKIQSCLSKADSASKNLLALINDILDISKIEADKFELVYSDFDLEKMLINITNVVNIRVEEKHQNFVVNLNKDVPLSIFGDELRLSQIITNLLANSIKFTPEYGKVILSIEKAEEKGDEITLKIEIADSGIGISEEQQKQLFTSFEQADHSITQKFGGTGLGLAISKRIVELMDGAIWIESELNKGAKFIFTIKVKKGKEKIHNELNLKIDRDNIRVLAVDDSDEVRAYFAHVMDYFNLPCDVAANGKEALELINKYKDRSYNVFFVDWKMPGMDGIELAKKIGKIADESSVIIMLSEADWYSVETEAIAAGVKLFIPKPLFPSMLVDVINECLGTESVEIADKLQKKKAEKSFNFADHTILVAEDNEINREILIAVLEKTGVSIDFAENGKIAVSMFEEHPDRYSLILMDVQMLEMNGYEATRAIRNLDHLQAKDIPIIAMTANVFREDIENCLSAGMDGHIGKPIDPDILYKTIKKHITPFGKGNKAMKEIENGIIWDDSLSLGNDQIDMQHHQMFEFLSSLVSACVDGTETAKLKETLDFLVNYTLQHFSDEETWQLRHGYPEYEKHKWMHDDFKVTIGGMVHRFTENGSSEELSNDVNRIVVRWVVDHILHEDKKLGAYIRSITGTS